MPGVDDARVSRLFVAVLPPEDVLDLVETLPRPAEAGLRWTTRSQWHLTLRFLGAAPEDEVAAALTALRAAPVRVELGPEVRLLGRHVLHVPAHGLEVLAGEVHRLTAGLGEPVEDRRYVGHLTLARRRHGHARPAVADPVAACFVAHEVALLRSHLEPTGARHEVVSRVPLVG